MYTPLAATSKCVALNDWTIATTTSDYGSLRVGPGFSRYNYLSGVLWQGQLSNLVQ